MQQAEACCRLHNQRIKQWMRPACSPFCWLTTNQHKLQRAACPQTATLLLHAPAASSHLQQLPSSLGRAASRLPSTLCAWLQLLPLLQVWPSTHHHSTRTHQLGEGGQQALDANAAHIHKLPRHQRCRCGRQRQPSSAWRCGPRRQQRDGTSNRMCRRRPSTSSRQAKRSGNHAAKTTHPCRCATRWPPTAPPLCSSRWVTGCQRSTASDGAAGRAA